MSAPSPLQFSSYDLAPISPRQEWEFQFTFNPPWILPDNSFGAALAPAIPASNQNYLFFTGCLNTALASKYYEYMLDGELTAPNGLAIDSYPMQISGRFGIASGSAPGNDAFVGVGLGYIGGVPTTTNPTNGVAQLRRRFGNGGWDFICARGDGSARNVQNIPYATFPPLGGFNHMCIVLNPAAKIVTALVNGVVIATMTTAANYPLIGVGAGPKFPIGSCLFSNGATPSQDIDVWFEYVRVSAWGLGGPGFAH